MKNTNLNEEGLSIKYVVDVLLKRRLISAEDHKEVIIKGDTQRARLSKSQDSFYTRSRLQSVASLVSPAEVISSFEWEMPDSNGKTLTEDIITKALAEELKLPYIKIDPLKLDLDIVTTHIPRAFAQRHLIVPVEEKNGLLAIAIADPFDREATENLSRTTNLKIKLVLASKGDILKIVREFYGFRSSVDAAKKEKGSGVGVELGNLEQFVKLRGTKDIEANDQHVVNAVDYLLKYAYDQRASDIHIEPKRDNSHVRLRIDGMLHHIHTIPKVVHPSMVSRIKMLSRMDIAEKRRPQDGRIKTEHNGKEIELRVSTMPTAFGEKIVIRIFDPQILFQELKDLGFYDREFDLFNSYLSKHHGIILVTGPTGSGKTTTLYSALKHLSTPEVNIITVEDPIEMIMEEFNQVGVQHNIGVDFASTLRTILRQDPDIIMIGEIRDTETANHAVQAALTGHLVLSTLHTNDAPTAVTRLTDLGVPEFLISATVLGVMAQRLMRKVCIHCKKERFIRPEEVISLGLPKKKFTVYYGEGCSECRGTGYKGRDGIFELMDVSPKMKSLLTKNSPLEDIYKLAEAEGMVNLRKNAIKKMMEGVTTYEEVVAITG